MQANQAGRRHRTPAGETRRDRTLEVVSLHTVTPQKQAAQTVILRGFRQRVVERLGKQPAQSIHGVQIARHGNTVLIHHTRQRLPQRTPIQAVARTPGSTHDTGAFQQALRIDHGVVMQTAGGAHHRAPFRACNTVQGAPAPAPQGNRNHSIHRRMPGGHLGEGLFHQPVKADAGKA